MYTVSENDTPFRIAQKLTGDGGRMHELLAVNPRKAQSRVEGLGTFTSLAVGEHLHVPTKWTLEREARRASRQVTGLGQNYLWDRYPGEIFPDEPAHTMSVGLAGCCGSVGSCGNKCTCTTLAWDPSSARDNTVDCVYHSNPGSSQPHLPAGVGPLGPANAADAADAAATLPASGALGQMHRPHPAGMSHPGFGQSASVTSAANLTGIAPAPTGGTTITPAPGGGSVVTSLTSPGQVTVPPAVLQVSSTPAAAPAAAPSTNTGLLVVGIAAVALGVVGIAYLAHARMEGS